MAQELKPFMVLVEETRRKPMIVWAEGEADASWKALSMCQQGVVSTEQSFPTHKIYSIRGADSVDMDMFPHYGKEGSK